MKSDFPFIRGPVAGMLVFLSGALHAAPAIEVHNGGCESGVRVTARDASLSQVLSRLSTTLGFELRFRAERDRTVTIDIARPPVELLAKLTESENVVFEAEASERCPGQQRLLKVWVLPAGEDGPPPPRPPTPMEIYRKAHGLPPEDPPPEADGAEPP